MRHAPVDEEELRRRRSTECIYYLALPVDLQEEVDCTSQGKHSPIVLFVNAIAQGSICTFTNISRQWSRAPLLM
uniref:Uncharacterized protein n=1 Tax=Triticum urartu TaxID=4572 RepID=A0A8R7U3X7_TRIUA